MNKLPDFEAEANQAFMSRLGPGDTVSHALRLAAVAEQGIRRRADAARTKQAEEKWSLAIVDSIGTPDSPERQLYDKAETKLEELAVRARRALVPEPEAEEEKKEEDDAESNAEK